MRISDWSSDVCSSDLIKHGHDPDGRFIKIFPDAMFQQTHIDHVIASLYPYFFTEVTNRCRRIATAAKGTDSRHAGIIPSIHDLFFNQLQQPEIGRASCRDREGQYV